LKLPHYKPLLVNLGWFAGLALLVGLLIIGSLVHLAAQRREVAVLQRTVQEQEQRLGQESSTQATAVLLERTESALREWQALTASDALRIAELSGAARASDVVLASFETLEDPGKPPDEGQPFVARAYRLLLVGGYRELAHFCARVYAARGLAAIDDLQIEAGEAAGPERLQATLQVTWYGPARGYEAVEAPQ
jgi:hypothetical protein